MEPISPTAAFGAVEILVSTSPLDVIGCVDTLRSTLGFAARDLRPTLTSEAISAVGDAETLVSIIPLAASTFTCGGGAGRTL